MAHAKERLARLPAKPKRDAAAHDAAEALKQAARDARFAFLRRHARTLYDRLTDGRRKFVRIERLVYDAAELVPGLVPTRAEVLAEAELRQSEKDGCEIDQGILCNQFLADPECGLHLCHAMLLPREESAEALAKFLRDGRLDLGFARVERQGKAAVLLLANKRFLNSEDNSTQPATEIARRRLHPRSARARSRCCAATSCRTASMPAAASTMPASTSRISITARSRSCGSWSATSVS